MTKKIVPLIILAIFLLPWVDATAGSDKPNFSPSVYADGIAWGTKATTELPPPNDHNVQSYDILYVITNGPEGQLPVGDAAPRNRNYNGGRWFTHTVEWTPEGIIAMGEPLPVLKSYEDIMLHYGAGQLDIWPGSPGGPPDYFQCPLLPVKAW